MADDRVPEPLLSRRTLLVLASLGIGGVGMSLAGCGGGQGTAVPGSLVPRSEPSGDLAQQIDQYSRGIDRLSSLWQARSHGLDQLMAVLDAGRGRGRAIPPGQVAVSATFFGLRGLRTLYELLCRQALELDNIGYLAARISQTNQLPPDSALENPQWVAAMMERNYTGLAYVGLIAEFAQCFGLKELAETVREQTDPDSQLLAYGILGEIFNDWVGEICDRVAVAVDPTWQLDMGERTVLTVARTHRELDRIPDILAALPFGPGFNTAPILPLTRQVGMGETILDPVKEIPSILGGVAEKIKDVLDDPKKTEEIIEHLYDYTNSYAKRIDINTTRLAQFVLKNLRKDLTKDVLKAIAKKVIETWLGKLAGEAADCVFEIISGSIELGKLFSLTVGTLEIPPLAVVFATLAALKIVELLTKIEDCIQKLHIDPPPIIERHILLRGKVTETDFTPIPVRTIPVVTNPIRAESDQLRKSAVIKGHVTLYRRRPRPLVELKAVALKLGDVASSARTTVSGTPYESSTQGTMYGPDGQVLATTPGRGRAVTGVLVRSYAGVETAAALLLYEYARTHPDTVLAEDTGDGFAFFGSELALLVRREPGTSAVQVPSITGAQLLCTSPGFTPIRSAGPEDLTTLLALPQLQPATGLSNGGEIHVH
jgi:hypothetical protein